METEGEGEETQYLSKTLTGEINRKPKMNVIELQTLASESGHLSELNYHIRILV